MKKFILSDLHIGHETAQYDIMDQAISYIRKTAQAGDEILGLGDWFHFYENGFNHCLGHPMTKKLRELAATVPTRLLPGNHDRELEKYRDNPSLVNPISPIAIARPFISNGIWYCHGHEYDPAVQYLPRQLMWLWNKLTGRITPGNLRSDSITEKYLMLVYIVYSRAIYNLQRKVKTEHPECRGIVLGHTHLPVYLGSPELLFLLDDGDMRHSSTFTVEDGAEFRQMTWDQRQNLWRVTRIPRP